MPMGRCAVVRRVEVVETEGELHCCLLGKNEPVACC